VEGLVHLDVDEQSLARLDRFEGALYERVPLAIVCADGGQRQAETYVVSPQNRKVLTAEPWSAQRFQSSGALADFVAHFQGFSRLEADG
jgi:hypothetical protein